jgi:NAD+ kinase
MKFALEVRQGPENALVFSEKLRAAIDSVGGMVVDEGEAPDLVIAVGGDGTVLAAAQRALAHDVPVLGFNLGTMGFLAEAEPEDLEWALGRLMSGDYEVLERMTVTATVAGRSATGVNDVIVEKVDSQRLIHLDVSVDGDRFLTYRADGLIVATPTGSTAYSLSARGPIVAPTHRCLLLTPVSPHMLFDRTLVFDPSTVVRLEVLGNRAATLSVDGRTLATLNEGDAITCTAAPAAARLVMFGKRDFLRILKTKFGLNDR